MTNGCSESAKWPKWKDALLDAALTGRPEPALEEHMKTCAACAAEFAALQARRAQLDSLLPFVAQGAEPPPDFRVRVLAAAEAEAEGAGHAAGVSSLSGWRVAAAAALIVAALVVALRLHRPPTAVSTPPAAEIAAAEKLAEWRAPSDVLLATPGREILRGAPKLGESYLRVPANSNLED
jgi:anti-sigma factor RsiW